MLIGGEYARFFVLDTAEYAFLYYLFDFLVTRRVTVVLLFFPFGKLVVALISHVAQFRDRPWNSAGFGVNKAGNENSTLTLI